MGNIKITGTGRCLGEKVVSNDDIAMIVDTSDQWTILILSAAP